MPSSRSTGARPSPPTTWRRSARTLPRRGSSRSARGLRRRTPSARTGRAGRARPARRPCRRRSSASPRPFAGRSPRRTLAACCTRSRVRRWSSSGRSREREDELLVDLPRNSDLANEETPCARSLPFSVVAASTRADPTPQERGRCASGRSLIWSAPEEAHPAVALAAALTVTGASGADSPAEGERSSAPRPPRGSTIHMVFSVRLSKHAARAFSGRYYTVDGTAKAGSDYVATSGKIKIPKGSSRARIVVKVIDDEVAEPDEHFVVVPRGDQERERRAQLRAGRHRRRRRRALERPLTRRRETRGPGPTYAAVGRTRRLRGFCSRMCADQPATRAHVNIGVNR